MSRHDNLIHIVLTVKDMGYMEQTFEDWRQSGEIKDEPYRCILDWKPLSAVCAGEQDLVLAGGEPIEEQAVHRFRESGQIVARYSSRFASVPLSGRQLHEVGYSLDMAPDALQEVLSSKRFLRGLAERDGHDMQMGLLGLRAHPTSYLWDCCRTYHLNNLNSRLK